MGEKSRIITNRNARKQHIISEMHLRHFIDSVGKIYVYEKNKPIRNSTPHNECASRDYFECKLPGHETNFKVENMLGKLETDASPIYAKLIAGQELTSIQIATWAFYVSSLFLRSRKIREELSVSTYQTFSSDQMTTTTLKNDQWKIFNELRLLISLDEIEEAKSRLLKAYADPALRQITSMDYSTPNLANALAGKRWQVVCPAPGMCFVTNDAPVFSFRLLEQGSEVGIGWGYKDVHIGFPLDPQHLFIASPKEIQWMSPIDVANTVALIGTMAQFSYKTVYANSRDEQIQELVELHSGSLLFGTNAYATETTTEK